MPNEMQWALLLASLWPSLVGAAHDAQDETQLFVDMALVASSSGAEVRLHRPVEAEGRVLVSDEPWENIRSWAYNSVVDNGTHVLLCEPPQRSPAGACPCPPASRRAGPPPPGRDDGRDLSLRTGADYYVHSYLSATKTQQYTCLAISDDRGVPSHAPSVCHSLRDGGRGG